MADMKQFSQTDPAWKSKTLGFDKTSNIGSFGCLLTSVTMLASGYGVNETPDSLNEKLKAVAGFSAGTAFLVPGALPAVLPGIRYITYTRCWGVPAPLAEIDGWLARGKPVIIEVDWSPQAGVQTHYMVLYGKEDGDYLVYDPYPFPVTNGKIKLGQSKYAQIAGTKDPAKIITGVMYFDGPGAAVPPPPPPQLDKGVYASFPVYASADELAIRSQMLVAENTLLKRVAANTEMKVLEADASAAPKIGVQNQWIPVKLADGTQGYTAAWLVSKTKNNAVPAPGTPPIVVPVPKDAPVVKASTDGLKLRSKPDTTDATILKVLPIGAELKVLEPASEVQRKVGKMYEWLKVADLQNTQGVVAAWYVNIVSLGGAAFGPEAQRQTAAPNFAIGEIPPLILRTAEEGVALRAKAFISPQTLIQRLPLGSELIALGRADTAAKKLGKAGKWIRVKDVRGNRGYVAAWLVEERPEDPAPQVSPADC
ncbi:MAG: hypothetical protein OHK0031_07680 [Anaerolineales bacterium]